MFCLTGVALPMVQTKAKVAKSADGFFKEAGAKEELSDARKADQKAVDTAVRLYASLRPCLALLRDLACCAPAACWLRAGGERRGRWCGRRKGEGICSAGMTGGARFLFRLGLDIRK